MADPDSPDPVVRILRPPTQCVLWQQPGLIVSAGREFFEVVEVFEDSSHSVRSLLKCRECGQLYFAEFYESVDWDEGDDSQYSTYVPVQTQDETDALKKGAIFDIFYFTPRLQWDCPKGAKVATTRWIGKPD
jgi:hypothetical protein